MNVLMNITTAATVTVLCVMVYRSLSPRALSNRFPPFWVAIW